jgi:hypothetical protein
MSGATFAWRRALQAALGDYSTTHFTRSRRPLDVAPPATIYGYEDVTASAHAELQASSTFAPAIIERK